MSLETFSYTTGPHRLWVREAEPWHCQDLKVLREVLDDDCYRLDDIGPRRLLPTVVDVGAHIGGFMRACELMWPGMRYLGAELHPDNAALAQVNAAKMRGNCVVSNVAVDYGRGTPTFCDSVIHGGTATGASRLDWSGEEVLFRDHPIEERPGDVVVTTLEKLIAPCIPEANTIDILKLDCEGAEHRIIDGFQQWDRVGIVLVEYHGRAEWERRIRSHPYLSRWHRTTISRREDKSIGVERLVNPYIDCEFDTNKLVTKFRR